MLEHVPGCRRTANSYDPDCPRCEEIRASVHPASRPRNPMEVEREHTDALRRRHQVERQANTAFAVALLIAALAGLFILISVIGHVFRS